MSSYHYSFYSPTDCTAWVFSHRFHCLGFLPQISQIYTELLVECILPQISQIHTEVRLPSRGCTCLRSALPLARARSAPTKQEVHQLSKIDILPRNPQNPQNCLLSVFSHRLHRFTQKLGCLQGGALVSSAPTKQEVHQPSNIDIPLVTLVHLRQVHPLKLAASVSICEICGRLFSAEGSVNSACSVGGILRLRRQGYLRYYLPHPNHLCQSVKSVGDSSLQKVL